MKKLQTGLTMRGDFYYCPLAFQLSTYWNCEARCAHCYLRRLNRTWGEDLRPLDVAVVRKQIINADKGFGIDNDIAKCIRLRKTVYLGAKSDPYQHCELKYGATRDALIELLSNGFSVVIATMFTENMERDRALLTRYRDQVTIMPIVAPGLDKDWEILEDRKTTRPIERLRHAAEWKQAGFNVGINGEPFIGGFHTVEDFENVVKIIASLDLTSYNTYNLHFNDWNAKAMHERGVDIGQVWEANQDAVWGQTLPQLIDIAEAENVVLGSPDFINSGSYVEKANTCCGLTVPNPLTGNIIHWKRQALMESEGLPGCEQEWLARTWENIGNYDEAYRLLTEKRKDMFTLMDVKWDNWRRE